MVLFLFLAPNLEEENWTVDLRSELRWSVLILFWPWVFLSTDASVCAAHLSLYRGGGAQRHHPVTWQMSLTVRLLTVKWAVKTGDTFICWACANKAVGISHNLCKCSDFSLSLPRRIGFSSKSVAALTSAKERIPLHHLNNLTCGSKII